MPLSWFFNQLAPPVYCNDSLRNTSIYSPDVGPSKLPTKCSGVTGLPPIHVKPSRLPLPIITCVATIVQLESIDCCVVPTPEYHLRFRPAKMSERSYMDSSNRKRRPDNDGDESSSAVGSGDSQRPETDGVAAKLFSDETKKPATETKEALFQYKLYEILQCEDFKEILTWLPHGRSWKIIDSEALTKYVLPKYFRHSKYSSFKRQMSGWGFRRGIKVNEYNEYNHPVSRIHSYDQLLKDTEMTKSFQL